MLAQSVDSGIAAVKCCYIFEDDFSLMVICFGYMSLYVALKKYYFDVLDIPRL